MGAVPLRKGTAKAAAQRKWERGGGTGTAAGRGEGGQQVAAVAPARAEPQQHMEKLAERVGCVVCVAGRTELRTP